jgi:hypothetical protein
MTRIFLTAMCTAAATNTTQQNSGNPAEQQNSSMPAEQQHCKVSTKLRRPLTNLNYFGRVAALSTCIQHFVSASRPTTTKQLSCLLGWLGLASVM